MDWKKLLKKLGFPENLTYPRKVFSGFSLGVGVSLLLLTLFFLNHPLKAPFLSPVFQSRSWPFSFSGSSEKTNLLGRSKNVTTLPYGGLSEKTHGDDFTQKGKNATFLGSRGGETVLKKTHGGNVPEIGKNATYKNSTVEGVPVKTQVVKSVGKEKNETFVGKSGRFEGIVTEKNNSSGNGENGRSKSGEESGSEDTHEVKSVQTDRKNNSSGDGENGRSKVGEGSGSKIPNEVKSVQTDRNGSFTGKSEGIADVGVKGNNLRNGTGNGESVRSIGKEKSVVEKPPQGNSTKESKSINSSNGTGVGDATKCDIYDGRWVRDKGKPYYPAGSCPHIDRDFDCYLNGRPDDDFVRWRWQPNHCDIPSMNATDFLERLRGKKLIFVGDSLNRNMWESLVCLLRHTVPDKKKVYEISGRKEFKKKGFYAFRYEDYNCSVDFVSSTFLVRPSSFKTRNETLETLRLDLMDRTTATYHDADVIVFNTGHWWTHEKTSKGENYYQEGNHVYPTLNVLDAYMKALTTWARWVDKNIDAKRTQVFFRGYSLTHFRGGQWNSGGQCHKESEPILNDTHLAKYPSKMKVLEHVLEKMRTPIVYMNISKLTDYRKDAHPSIYRKEYKTPEEKLAAESSQDCSHWCLPGIPDTWNELLYASLLRTGSG